MGRNNMVPNLRILPSYLCPRQFRMPCLSINIRVILSYNLAVEIVDCINIIFPYYYGEIGTHTCIKLY